MNKFEKIQYEIEREIERSFPETSERMIVKTKRSPEFIRHQFIDTVNNIKGIKDMKVNDPNRFRQIIDKVKKKYDDLYEEIETEIFAMEERIYDMARGDYAIQQEVEDEDDISNEDIPEEMIAEFVSEEWHHNMENRFNWAKDYFPDSRQIEVDNYNPIHDFMSKYVYPIENEIKEVYNDFINMDKKVKDNIRRNYQNIFNYIFDESKNLVWDRTYRGR